MDQTIKELFDKFLSTHYFYRRGQKRFYAETTKDKFRNKMGEWLQRHGSTTIDKITESMLLEYFQELKQRGYSDGNLAFYRNCFHKFFSYGSPFRTNKDNPADVIEQYDQRPAYIVTATPEQIGAILELCDSWALSKDPIDVRNAAILSIGTTGARRGNIAQIPFTAAVQCLNNPIIATTKQALLFMIRTTGKEPMEIILDERRAHHLSQYINIRPKPKPRHNILFISSKSR